MILPQSAARFFALLIVALAITAGVPSEARAQDYKKLPPAGQEIDSAVRRDLRERLEALQNRLDMLAEQSDDAAAWRPDVEVFLRAVRLALQQNLFYKGKDPQLAKQLLQVAGDRLDDVVAGRRGLLLMGLSQNPQSKPQPLVGGFVSKIDGSVQPFGLVVPANYVSSGSDANPPRLDVWLHGRGDNKTEMPFLHERMNQVGQYSPEATFVLHPFGRHCNAFKFAGETDVYEALAHVQTLLPIDSQRIAIRGFSMGGAGCWHFAVHDPTRWFAANPGAGFVDTLVYQGWRGTEGRADAAPFPIDDVQQKLLRWYDVLPWVSNLKNTHVVAYSGEVDKQKQAADRVYEASRAIGLSWPYVIGEQMGHKIDEPSAEQIEALLQRWSQQPTALPEKELSFVTYTLRYNEADWLRVTGLQQHWQRGEVQAEISGEHALRLSTAGVTALELDFQRSGWPRDGSSIRVDIDGQTFEMADVQPERSGFQAQLAHAGQQWHVGEPSQTLRKRPGLQGPIDDAFTSSFLFVIPSRPAAHGRVERWLNREREYAITRWKQIMRGDPNIVRDIDLTPQQIRDNHLVCFGDFQSNQFLKTIAQDLPIQWTRESLIVGTNSYDPGLHAPVFCYPNPRNPNKYVVVNSGMTFREFSNNSNSRQIAMLPDWAVIDVTSDEIGIFPGKIADRGFFDEQWSLEEVATAEI